MYTLDPTTILAETLEDLQYMLNRINEIVEQFGLEIVEQFGLFTNNSKIKMIAISRQLFKNLHVSIIGEYSEGVNKFNNLG